MGSDNVVLPTDINNGNRPSSRQPTSNLSGVAAPAPVRAAEQSQVGSPQASSADRPAHPQNPAQPAFDIQASAPLLCPAWTWRTAGGQSFYTGRKQFGRQQY